MKHQADDKQADVRLDPATRLAFERTYLAHERTQMAWARTSLALISFGFATDQFLRYLHEQRPELPPLMKSDSVGILMIVLGLVALALASIQHRRALRALRAQHPELQPSLAWVMVTLLGLLGVLALVVVVLRE
jgi:putative membrane protein